MIDNLVSNAEIVIQIYLYIYINIYIYNYHHCHFQSSKFFGDWDFDPLQLAESG